MAAVRERLLFTDNFNIALASIGTKFLSEPSRWPFSGRKDFHCFGVPEMRREYTQNMYDPRRLRHRQQVMNKNISRPVKQTDSHRPYICTRPFFFPCQSLVIMCRAAERVRVLDPIPRSDRDGTCTREANHLELPYFFCEKN